MCGLFHYFYPIYCLFEPMTDKLYREFLLSSPIGFFHATLHLDASKIVDFEILGYNSAFPELFSLNDTSLVGVKFTNLFPTETLHRRYWLDKLNECYESNSVIGFQQYSPVTQRWYQVYLQLISSSEVAGQILDISIAKKSEERLNSLIHIFEDVIFELDRDLNFKEAIASEAHLFLPRDQFIGKNIKDVFEGDFLKLFQDTFKKAKETQEVQIIRYDSPIPNRKNVYKARVIYRPATQNRDEDYFISIADITSKVNSERALEFHKEFEQLLVECTTLIIQSDESTFNQRMDEVLKRIGEFSKVDRAYYFNFDEQAKTFSNLNEWCAEGVEPQIEYLQDTPIDVVPNWTAQMIEGKEVYIDDLDALDDLWAPERELLAPQGIQSLLSLPVCESGKLYGFLGFDAVKEKVIWSNASRNLLQILADNLGSVIRRNIQNRELQEKTKQAEILAQEATIASKAKSEFLANMSHEIRTPLNGVVGFGELLKGTQLDSIQEQYVRSLTDSAVSLMDLINQILDFSKIEAGKMLLDLEKSDLRQILENSIALVRHSAGQKNLELTISVDPHLPRYVITDAVRLRQIIVNLLSNAVKFTEKGRVSLVAELRNTEGENVVLNVAVSDTGIGISKEQEKFLFKAFGQADTSTSKKYGGTGLGLVISNNLLGMMNSKLDLVSNPGLGSSFSFNLALKKFEEETIFSDFKFPSKSIAVISKDKNFNESIKAIVNLGKQPLKELTSLEDLIGGVLQNDIPGILIVNEDGGDGLNIDFVKKLRESKLSKISEVPILLYHRKETAALYEQCRLINKIRPLMQPVLPTELVRYLQVLESQEMFVEAKPNTIQKKGGNENEKSKKILIVEDNEVNLLLTRILVSQLYPDAHIVEAYNGIQAVKAVEDFHPDLVLMDIQMPEMDGHEATRRIREMDFIDLPIVALTANAVVGEKENCLASGANDYLTKPIEKENLRVALSKFLG